MGKRSGVYMFDINRMRRAVADLPDLLDEVERFRAAAATAALVIRETETASPEQLITQRNEAQEEVERLSATVLILRSEVDDAYLRTTDALDERDRANSEAALLRDAMWSLHRRAQLRANPQPSRGVGPVGGAGDYSARQKALDDLVIIERALSGKQPDLRMPDSK